MCCDDFSPVSIEMCVTRSYDHTVKLWDVRVIGSKLVMEVNQVKRVESGFFAISGVNCYSGWEFS